MNPDRIELRETRRIGDIIGDSIQFIKQNFKDIVKNIVLVALPFFVITALLLALRHFTTFKGYATILYAIGIISAFLVISLFNGIICEYIVLYVKNDNQPPALDILLKALKRDTGMIIITNIINTILIFFLFGFLIIPGVYAMLPLSMIMIIRINERTGYFAAMDKSFRLIAGNWWRTLGMYIVLLVVMILLVTILFLPIIILGGVGSLYNIEPKGDYAPLARAAFDFFNQLGNILYIILITGSAFLYYSLSEKKEGTGLLERIKKLKEKHEST